MKLCRYLSAQYTFMVHRGEKLEKAIRESGISISSIARRLGKSRKHMYNLFENPQISIDVMLEVGKIIHYDFLKDLEYFSKTDTSAIRAAESDEKEYDSVEYWKNKYLKLLEKHNALLEKLTKQKNI